MEAFRPSSVACHSTTPAAAPSPGLAGGDDVLHRSPRPTPHGQAGAAAPPAAERPGLDPDAVMRHVYARIMAREGVSARHLPPSHGLPDGRFLQLRRIEAYLRHQHRLFGEQIKVTRGGLRGRAERLIKRVIRKVLAWYAQPQMDLNASLYHAVSECLTQLQTLGQEVAELRARQAVAEAQTPEQQPSRRFHRLAGQLRPPAAHVRERLGPLVDEFAARDPVADLGCGRGEFLELLQAAGVAAYGVEPNPDLAALCHTRGLRVVGAELVDHLGNLPANCLGGVNLSRVVEQLSPVRIHQLLGLAVDRIVRGGVLVAETPNPLCEAVLHQFFFDPCRLRPVPPDLLRLLGEDVGLTFSHFRFTSPLAGVTPVTVRAEAASGATAGGYQDYAAVFRRA